MVRAQQSACSTRALRGRRARSGAVTGAAAASHTHAQRQHGPHALVCGTASLL
jgi:hypothetical protein